MFGGVGADEQPVGLGELIHCRGQQVFGQAPFDILAVDGPQDRGLARQVCEQHPHPPGRQQATVVVEQVDPVVAKQIRLDGLGIFAQEEVEAEPSPRLMPVSLPYPSNSACTS